MAVNSDKLDRWTADIAQSVDMYNDWFMRFAPDTYRATRLQTTKDVEKMFKATKNLTDVGVDLLKSMPSVLPSLRMSTCPPLAMDRLVGLAGVSKTLVNAMENKNKVALPMTPEELNNELNKIG